MTESVQQAICDAALIAMQKDFKATLAMTENDFLFGLGIGIALTLFTVAVAVFVLLNWQRAQPRQKKSEATRFMGPR